jgi:ParB-like chromosome segregation protein Spo0J
MECVPINALLPADSPRTAGLDTEHIRMLAALAESLPPIVVDRSTMRVVDGMHRVRAAELRGDDVIAVRFVNGDETDTFVLAVQLNHAHGLPLTLADRTAAAARIVRAHPEWSNRRIAAVTGLAANTVGAVRRRSGTPDARPDIRIGRDGKARSEDAAAARRRASDLIADNPDASLREIAKAAGISLATVSDVRKRLRRGQPPITPRQRETPRRRRKSTVIGARRRSHDAIRALRQDPSLRFTDGGRTLLRVLDSCAFGADQWERIVASVPPHHKDEVVRLARFCAQTWQQFADRLTDSSDAESARESRSG